VKEKPSDSRWSSEMATQTAKKRSDTKSEVRQVVKHRSSV
jgi:hypothetical protein